MRIFCAVVQILAIPAIRRSDRNAESHIIPIFQRNAYWHINCLLRRKSTMTAVFRMASANVG
jgi:hypothetical protein